MPRASYIVPCILLILSLGLPNTGSAQIALHEMEYFSGPGFSFYTFHNNYVGGYQAGLQLVQNGERLLDSGDLYLVMKAGQTAPRQLILRRTANPSTNSVEIEGQLEGWNNGYRLNVRTDGKRVLVGLNLDRPLDQAKVTEAGFRIALYPAVFVNRSFQGNNGDGVFPQQYTGQPTLLNGASVLRVAQEEPRHTVTISRSAGTLTLGDGRYRTVQGWFTVAAPLDPGSTGLEVAITPALDPAWRRPPVIGVSQVGYHPKQKKTAVLELDGRSEPTGNVRLLRMDPQQAPQVAKQGPPKDWGKFHSFHYATFDFTEVDRPGVYTLEYAGQKAGPFRIATDVLEMAWRPTLQYFMPIQMCHVMVRQGTRVWHGACHLDDALQAPANTKHLDGYEQAERETRYGDNQHVPGLDWGGWHDAGDHDIPAGSVANTMQALALAYEEFRPQLDETTIDRKNREVLLHVPDGRPDLLQQVEYGAEWLLATFRAAGHILPGVVESTRLQYGHMGDMVSVTDNRVYDPGLKPDERSGERSGKLDDRWVFTNRNTGLQYQTAQSLAIASRVLRDFNPDLAKESITVAMKLWEHEQATAPIYARSAYTPSDSGYRSQEIGATTELYLTTGERRYAAHLDSMLPLIRSITPEQFGQGPGWTLARAYAKLSNPELKKVIRAHAEQWKEIGDRRAATNPYGVRYPDEVTNPGYKLESRTGIHSGFVWGHGWTLQTDAMRHYFFHRSMPDLFSPKPVLDLVNFVLGCHPATNESFVSGVGAYSTLAAYGFNRADWSHVPGGVISGTSLIKPDLMELKTFPFLWYQTEYVIHGGATYIFDVLAAQKLIQEAN